MLVTVVALLTLLVVVIQIPYVQTRITHKFAENISQKTGFESTIKSIHVKWFDTVVLDSVMIKDQRQKEMIWVKNLAVDFNLFSLINGRTITLDEARIDEARVHLYKDTIDSQLNLNSFIKAIRDLTRKKENSNSLPPIFTIEKVQLRNSIFYYFDANEEAIAEKFDYHHFQIDNINGDVDDFRIVADTLELDMRRLNAYEATHDFTVHDFTGFYRLTDQNMTFRDFKLYAGNSILQDSVVFNYDSQSALSYFNDSVTIVARIDQTKIHSKDLALFAPYLKRYNEFYTFSGHFKGEVKSFSVKDFALNFGAQSHMAGDVNFDGLPDFKETFIDLDLKNSVVDVHDLEQYIQNDSISDRVKVFGIVGFDAEFLGFPGDFVANGQFDTQLGKVNSDINLKLDTKIPEYSGKLALYDFDLGAVTQRPDLLQKTSFRGSIKGQGLTLNEADFNLKAKFDYLGVNHYNFANIKTDARLGTSFFEGKVSINDPNLKFNAEGTVNLREGEQNIILEAQLDTAFLQAINLTKDDAFISTRLKANTHGLELDSLKGTTQFDDLFLVYQGRQLNIDSLWIKSEIGPGQREFSLHTNKFEALLAGNYQFSTLISDIQMLLKEYRIIFSNDKEELASYFTNRSQKTQQALQDEDYELNYHFKLDDINPVLHLFAPDISVSANTFLEGRITGGFTHIFSLNTQIDTFQYKENYFYQNQVDISASKIAGSKEVLAMVYVDSDQQEFKRDNITLQTEKLFTEAIWANDHIDVQQSIRQQETDNHASLAGNLTFLQDSTIFRINNADMQVLDRKWSVFKGNSVLLANNEITFDSLVFFNTLSPSEHQEISANGVLSADPNKQLTVRISNFLIDNLNPLMAHKYQGSINGFVDIQKVARDSADNRLSLLLDSEIAIQNFGIGTFLVGDVIGLAKWDNQDSLLNMNMMVNRAGERIISVDGTYNPNEEEAQLNLAAKLDKARLNVAEPYMSDILSDIDGTISGNVTLTGRLNHPILKGSGTINNGAMKINYLNTNYSLNGDVVFEENAISVHDLLVQDSRGESAYFNGGFFHDGFKNFVVDLNGTLNNMTVLNTSLKDNDMFYGKAYASGTVSLLGAINSMDISTRLKTEKGTKIYIPIGGVEGVEKLEYINFVDMSDSSFSVEGASDKINLGGLNLDLNIEVTPDAYSEIVFDAKTGDIIRGRGNGQLQFLITREGDFEMFGDVAFTEGAYNFTLYNIINKEFQIQPGSSIAWLGDPYGGILDIKATYEQLASLSPLVLDESEKQKDEVRRKYSALVQLNLTGNLMSPNVGFDIDVLNYPQSNISLQTAVAGLKNSSALNREELKRQVFSLIVLRRFSERDSFDGSNAVGSSVSEFLSNQFSYWFSQVDENLEVDLDLGTFDQDKFNTFQLRLSYTMLDGRLRITRAGGFTNVRNETSTASVIGDVSVEYLLRKDGKLRIKIFNRNNFNVNGTRNLNIANSTTQGISLLYVQNFDKVKELLTNARNAAIKKMQQDQAQLPVPSDTIPANQTEEDKPAISTKMPEK